MLRNDGVNGAEFAESVRALLDEDPRRYRNFGVYWFFVKAILKRQFDRHQMPMLGDYQDSSVVARMPPNMSANDLLAAAIDEYRANATLNLGRNRVEDPDGEFFTLLDRDVEG